MQSHIFLLFTLTMACKPDYAKVENTDSNPNNSNNSEDGSGNSETTSPSETDPAVDPSEDTLRCCYYVEMTDFASNGWQRGLLSVITDDGVYANLSLAEGSEGFREICIPRDSTVSFSWNPGLDNEDVGIGIFNDTEDLYFGENPQEGILAESISTCSDEFAVGPTYEEFDSTNIPDAPNPEGFVGDYIGIFDMYNLETGESLCQMDMVMTIDEDGVFTASESCSVNGTSTLISHNGSLYTDGMEVDSDGNVFAMGVLSGTVGVTSELGFETESEFYGECILENNTTLINISWDSLILPPNGAPQLVIGQLSYPY